MNILSAFGRHTKVDEKVFPISNPCNWYFTDSFKEKFYLSRKLNQENPSNRVEIFLEDDRWKRRLCKEVNENSQIIITLINWAQSGKRSAQKMKSQVKAWFLWNLCDNSLTSSYKLHLARYRKFLFVTWSRNWIRKI